MSFIDIPGGLLYPRPVGFEASVGVFTSLLIDASGEKAALIFRVPRTGTLNRVAFRFSTVTAAPTNGLRVSFQDVDLATGDPDGVQDQYRDIATGSVTSNTWITTGLITSDGTDTGTKRTVTAGDYICVVIEFAGAYVAGNVQITAFQYAASVRQAMAGSFYTDLFTGTWAKGSSPLLFGLEYSDNVYYPIIDEIIPMLQSGVATFNAGTAIDERGNRFTMPFTCKVDGIWGRVGTNTVGDYDVVLYDTNGSTVLASAFQDKEVKLASNTTGMWYPFATPVTLYKDLVYRIVLKPQAAGNVFVQELDVNSAGLMNAVPPGSSWYHTSRVDAGAWTDTTTKRAMMGVRISAVDVSSAVQHPRFVQPTRSRRRQY